MKNIIFIFSLFLCMISAGIAQTSADEPITRREFNAALQVMKTFNTVDVGWKVIYYLPNKTKHFEVPIEKDFVVYLADSNQFYKVTVNVATNYSMSTVFLAGAYLPMGTSWNANPYGNATVTLLGDTVGISVSGLTTTSKVMVCYNSPTGVNDSVCYVKQCRKDWLTLGGDNGKVITWWVIKK